jgi:hypothetical protein
MLRRLVQEGMRGGGPEIGERLYVTRERPRSTVWIDVTDEETVSVLAAQDRLAKLHLDYKLAEQWGVDVAWRREDPFGDD